jgi:group II intron maturase
VEDEIRALTPRTSQQDLEYVLTRRNQVMHGWASYFRHAVAKNVFAMLDNFAWWRVIRMLTERHRWRWKDIRRRFTTPSGRWLPVTAGEVELRGSRPSRSPGTAIAAARSPTPGLLSEPDGRNRGEPVASRGARRVR